ncbi:ABC transporter ATP-binding protein [Sphaerisporangium corydalis]|uniref:ABC transporter ATP-binding protein n=1 Tax=Sphaerisporangium corydalis TaxID=1441875 RepID=A0ABV9E8D3_9ACTN|nr:ABC transporter ATP-binding protein [Sphaerisporangium corydalis]
MSDSAPELPSSLLSVGRALRMGFRAEPLLLVTGGVLTLAAAVPDALLALGFKLLAEAVALGGGGRLVAAGALLAGLAVGSWLLSLAGERINLRFAERAAVKIESYVARLQSSVATIEHQERSDHLDLLAVLRDHAGALSQLYRSLFSTVGAVTRVLLTVGLLVSVRPLLGLLVVFAVPTVLVSIRRAAVENRAEQGGAQDRRMARHWFVLGSTAPAGKEVRVAGVQRRLRDGRREAWDRAYVPLARARLVSTVWQSAVWAVFGAAFVAGVAYVATGPGSPVAVAGSVTLALAAGGRLSQYVGQTVTESRFFRGIWLDASRRLTWLEEYAAARAGAADLPVPARLRQGVRFEDVGFTYPGSDGPVLDHVSVSLPAGSVVAVVGENGAGKTTLVKLLCRFYEPASGRVTVDGADLARLPPEEWRSRLAGTFQDFFRFEFQAGRAIGLGDLDRAGDLAAVGRAVERAGAGDVVATFPDGLATQLGGTWRGGVEVSFGQWQKLALARGFMRDDPLVLVLDEPTAALDAESEHALFERYAAAARAPGGRDGGRITVLVSHRFSTVRMADLIIVLDGARVLESGTHDELMADGGKYAELYRIQQASYR